MTTAKTINALPPISQLLKLPTYHEKHIPSGSHTLPEPSKPASSSHGKNPLEPATSLQKQAHYAKLIKSYPSPPLLNSEAYEASAPSIPPLEGNDPPSRQAYRAIGNESKTAPPSSHHHWFSTWNSLPNVQSLPSSKPCAPWTTRPTPVSGVDAESPVSPLPTQPACTPSESDKQHHHETPKPTKLAFTASGEPILKRRRGRPPSNAQESCTWEGGWTFLSPTVWSVNNSNQQQQPTAPPSPPVPVSPFPSSSQPPTSVIASVDAPSQSAQHTSDTTSIAAFTSSDMSTLMQMPRRKRGRKPKRHIEGHSCFVWKDVPIVRSPISTAKARATAAANRLKRERERKQQRSEQVQQQSVLVVDADQRDSADQTGT